MVGELNGCEVEALVHTAFDEAGRFNVDKFLQPYPLGPVKETVFGRVVLE